MISAGTLARLDRLIRFLDAATKSLTVDKDLSSIVKIADLALEFQDIGLDNIQFITVPWEYDQRDEYAGRVSWLPQADELWAKIAADEPLTQRLTSDAISAAKPPGSTDSPSGRAPGRIPVRVDVPAADRGGAGRGGEPRPVRVTAMPESDRPELGAAGLGEEERDRGSGASGSPRCSATYSRRPRATSRTTTRPQPPRTSATTSGCARRCPPHHG